MKRLAVIGLFLLSGCGFQGTYRYECQDPENWRNKECNPPICKVDGMCTETLLGFNPFEEGGSLVPTTTVAEKETITSTEGTTAP
jgi:hypothetical protein